MKSSSMFQKEKLCEESACPAGRLPRLPARSSDRRVVLVPSVGPHGHGLVDLCGPTHTLREHG